MKGRAALAGLCALACGGPPVMRWEQEPGALVRCYVDGERLRDRHVVEERLGPPCRSEVTEGPAPYTEDYYCASAVDGGWALGACASGCAEYRWAFIGITPVSCKPEAE